MIKTKLSRQRIRCFLIFALLLVLVIVPLAILAKPSNEVHIYGFPESRSYQTLLGYFSNKSDWKVTEYDLNNSRNSDELLNVVKMLAMEGVQVVPPEMCTPCALQHMTWEEIYLSYASPVAGFVRDGRLTAITIAITDYRSLDQILTANVEDHPKVFSRYKNETFTLADEDIEIQLQGFFKIGQKSRTDFSSLLPLIIAAAAVDAINPCEFYVLIVFLSLIFFRMGRKTVLKSGIAYSVAIFVIYYLMGFGLLKLILYVQEARLLVVILGISVGVRAVLNFVFGVFGLSFGLRDAIGSFLNRKFTRVPQFFSKRISVYLRMASERPITAFIIGVVTSTFLLPCTSGPYLIALSLIASLETAGEGLFLLTVYNAVIITPFLAITLGIYMLKLRTGELKNWASKKQRWLNLIAGLLMILLSLYLISTIMPSII